MAMKIKWRVLLIVFYSLVSELPIWRNREFRGGIFWGGILFFYKNQLFLAEAQLFLFLNSILTSFQPWPPWIICLEYFLWSPLFVFLGGGASPPPPGFPESSPPPRKILIFKVMCLLIPPRQEIPTPLIFFSVKIQGGLILMCPIQKWILPDPPPRAPPSQNPTGGGMHPLLFSWIICI